MHLITNNCSPVVVTYDGGGVDGRGVDGPALCTGVSLLLGNDKILASSLRLARFCLGPGLIGEANLSPTQEYSCIMVLTCMQRYYTLIDTSYLLILSLSLSQDSNILAIPLHTKTPD